MPAGLCFPPEAGLHSLAHGPFSIFQVSSWVESFSRGITLTSSPVFSTLKGSCDYTGSGSVGGGDESVKCSRRTRHVTRCQAAHPGSEQKSEHNGPWVCWPSHAALVEGRSEHTSQMGKEQTPPIVPGRRGRPKAILSFTSHSLWGNELSTEYSLLLAGQGGAGLFFTGKA